MTAENRKQRLQRLELLFVDSPIYFVTACTQNRRPLLAVAEVHESFLRFGQEGSTCGAYVLMPDHLHLFVTTDNEKITLARWMKSLKNSISKTKRDKTVGGHRPPLQHESRRSRRCMIVHDLPAVCGPLENQGEAAVWFVGRSVQRPSSEDQGGIVIQRLDLEFGKL
ncbi:MAG: REP-associated tyrosine transposase [Verrucomicrobiota bacterium]